MSDTSGVRHSPDFEYPTGSVPCSRCGLPVTAQEAATWSSSDGVVTDARHELRAFGGVDGCVAAMGARIMELEDRLQRHLNGWLDGAC